MNEERINANLNVGYKGKVEIQIKDGDRVVSSKVIKNKGKWPLFLFFAKVLNGKYKEAETQRPTYIQLYNVSNTDENQLFSVGTTWEKRTYPIRVSTDPKVDYITESSATAVESAWGILKFTIPFTLITKKENINLMALKSKSTMSMSDKDVCAYIIINDVGGLIPQELIGSEKYTLFISWTLSIQDQSVIKVEN